MSSGEMFVPKNLLEVCQGMQEAIALAPPDMQDAAGAEARLVIGPDVSYYGENKLEVRTLGAYALPDGLTLESEIWPVVHFGELRLRGHLAQVAYARVGDIKTLAWMMTSAKIRHAGPAPTPSGGIATDDEVTDMGFKGDIFRRPLYLPVGMIESVLIAA